MTQIPPWNYDYNWEEQFCHVFLLFLLLGVFLFLHFFLFSFTCLCHATTFLLFEMETMFSSFFLFFLFSLFSFSFLYEMKTFLSPSANIHFRHRRHKKWGQVTVLQNQLNLSFRFYLFLKYKKYVNIHILVIQFKCLWMQ
jgi:hypothetical protein